MSTWADIAAARYAADSLWPAELTLDMMGEDWAVFTVPVDLDAAVIFPLTDPNPVLSVGVCYPSSWDVDAQYIVTLRLTLEIEMRCTVGGETVDVFIVNGDNTETVDSSFTQHILTRTYSTVGGLPTGPTVELVHFTNPSDTAMNLICSRNFGERGATCFFQFVLSSAA